MASTGIVGMACHSIQACLGPLCMQALQSAASAWTTTQGLPEVTCALRNRRGVVDMHPGQDCLRHLSAP
jgi:hypothetical protein